MNNLSRRKELNISSRDRLCVAIAGLCHDLGHGPFSHMFDEFIRANYPTHLWMHEKRSILLFRRICQYPWVEEALLQFLDEEDFVFIEELILPPKKFTEDGVWLCSGRSVDKSFLYDIISNTNDSLDVDKLDYLLRDSHQTTVAIPFNQESIHRLIKWMRPLPVETKIGPNKTVTFLRICYAQKVAQEVLSVGQSRWSLFRYVYCHPTAAVIQHLMEKAFTIASPFLQFEGDDGQMYSLSKVTENMGAFIRCDDSVLQMIENSRDERLQRARDIVKNIKFRFLPKLLGTIELKPGESIDKESLIEDIVQRVEEKQKRKTIVGHEIPFETEKCFLFLSAESHRGSGLTLNPLHLVHVYNHKASNNQIVARPIDTDWIKSVSSEMGGSSIVNVYLTHEARCQNQEVAEILLEVLGEVADSSHFPLTLKVDRSSCPQLNSPVMKFSPRHQLQADYKDIEKKIIVDMC
ncbi:hypothetical protein AB6A40_008024 [Gnathostoma spinigerum]|uniref:HD domain-containing protein n=1 Tax=Gnathostoma spinigerum TaxID=75299 RepID=A0ABD6EYI8_9BILA